MKLRPQQYRLGWPWTPNQTANADEMFETLFRQQRELEARIGVAPPSSAGITLVGSGQPGPPGDPGEDGADGAPGPRGNDGAAGATGAQGPQGVVGLGFPGRDGEDTNDWPLPGPQGSVGSPGATGPTGPQGTIIAIGIPGYDGEDGEMGWPGPPGTGGGGSSAPTPALTVTGPGAWPATLNASTVGTIDWLWPHGTVTLPRQLAAGALHTKVLGGALAEGFDWILTGGTLFTGTTAGVVITTNAADDLVGTGIAGVNSGYQAIFVSGAAINFGFKFRVPACPNSTRTMRIYCFCFSNQITVTAALPGSGIANQSVAYDPGAGAGSPGLTFDIVYKGEGEVIVSVQTTINHGSSPNLGVLGAVIF